MSDKPRTKIIAELSSNHGGSLSRCLEMIIAAKHCGCWAAKFQYYKPHDLPGFDPKVNLPVPFWWLPEMFAMAKRLDIVLFPSIFHERAFKELPNCSIFKIASPESTLLTDSRYSMISIFRPKNIRLFVSSGRVDFGKMKSLIYPAEMLYCKAGYPATIDEEDMQFMVDHAVGFSDHTVGISSTVMMMGAGARYIEKHFKLDDNCVDTAFSLNPDQMKMLCDLAK